MKRVQIFRTIRRRRLPKKVEKKITSIHDAFKDLSENLARVADFPDINSYVPHAKQRKFHDSAKRIRLYIGGNRSGKTTGGIVEDIWWLTRTHPFQRIPDRPIAGRIVSVDFLNGIEKIIKPQLKQWLPPSQLRGGSWFSAYESSTRTLYLENGSFVELMSYDQDLDKFAGTSRDFVHFDEEPPETIYTENMARLIDRKGHCWITMTPVEGMTWIYDTIYEKGMLGDDGIDIVEVDMAENPHLDKEEVDIFLGSLSDDEREARGKGKFVQMGGLVYKAFNPKIHLIDPIDFAELKGSQYKHYMSLDHGFNNPTSVHWHAANTDNEVITFDEHYEAGQIIEYHAQVIHGKEKIHGRTPDIRICDPALAQKNAVTGTSIQTEYAIRGIGMVLGNNDVMTGVAKVNQYLALRKDGTPSWRITKNCANLIREISRLRWKTWASKKQASQNNPYDQIHKKDDHACDECRYFFSFMPELKQTVKMPERSQLPEIGGSSAKLAGMGSWNTDPNLNPRALSERQTSWKVSLNDD
jgi:phage terminase large subunit-like protein